MTVHCYGVIVLSLTQLHSVLFQATVFYHILDSLYFDASTHTSSHLLKDASKLQFGQISLVIM